MTILIKCIEREIEVLGTFENEDFAYDAMELDLAKEMNMDSIPEDWDEVEYSRYDEFNINPDSAWINKSDNYDWKIVTL